VRRGRPSILTKAGQAANQARIFVKNRKRARPNSTPDTMTIDLFTQIPSTLTTQGYFQALETQDQNADMTTETVTNNNESIQVPTSQPNEE
jgi:hypothetical protein